MKNKTKILLEIIIVIGLFIWYTIQVLIPELKKEYGSSDTFLNTKMYQNMIELKIDDKIDYAYVINKEEIVYHLFFFNKESTHLFNQDIENNTIEKAINKSLELLLKNNDIKDLSTITIIKYNHSSYDKIKKEIDTFISNHNLQVSIMELDSTLEEKKQELGINGETETKILSELDFYSKEITGIGNKKK